MGYRSVFATAAAALLNMFMPEGSAGLVPIRARSRRLHWVKTSEVVETVWHRVPGGGRRPVPIRREVLVDGSRKYR